MDGKPIKYVFVFTPSVGVKHFWVDLDGRLVFAHDLDFKSMTNLSQGSTKLDKTQCKSK